MKLQDLLFKFSTHIVHNMYLYFDIEEFNPYGNLSIQTNREANYFDVVMHGIFKPTDKPSDIVPPNFIIKDIQRDKSIEFIQYVFSDFIDDYRRVK